MILLTLSLFVKVSIRKEFTQYGLMLRSTSCWITSSWNTKDADNTILNISLSFSGSSRNSAQDTLYICFPPPVPDSLLINILSECFDFAKISLTNSRKCSGEFIWIKSLSTKNKEFTLCAKVWVTGKLCFLKNNSNRYLLPRIEL
jgi:hypothetical protein